MLWRPCYYRGLILQTFPTIHIAFTSHHSCKLHTSIDFRDHTGEERKANSLGPSALVVPSQRPKKRPKKLGQSQCASLILNLPLLPPLQPDPSFGAFQLHTTFFSQYFFWAFLLQLSPSFPKFYLASLFTPFYLLRNLCSYLLPRLPCIRLTHL